jgi:hypothetical protein
MYYLCKVDYFPDGQNKAQKLQILVNSTGVTEAEKLIANYMKDSMGTYEITAVTKTKIEKVIEE